MRIKGIPLRVHSSWFLILVLFTWISQAQVVNFSDDVLPVWFSWGLGLVNSLLLFLSVLLHELGHSFMALREGVKVRSITLFFLGGVARVERECATAMGSLRVALAGPLVSLVIAIILLRSVQSVSVISPFLANLFQQLGSLNLVLALFNLLPGLPLDGGVILKSLVWHFSGSQRRGVQVATRTGKILSITAIVFGTWLCFIGGGFSGLWLIVLGWFGLASSKSQKQILHIQEALSTLFVQDSSGRRFRVLEDDQSLKRLSELRTTSSANKFLLPEWVLICSAGRWVGYVTDEALNEVPVQNWDRYCLSEYTNPLVDLPSIGEKAHLWRAVIEVEKSEEGRLLVFNSAGLPSGTLDRVDIGNSVFKHLGLRLPSQIIELARKQNTYPLGIDLPQIVETMISSRIIDEAASSRVIE